VGDLEVEVVHLVVLDRL